MRPLDSGTKIHTSRNDHPDVRAAELDVAIVGGGISGLAAAHRLATRVGRGRNARVRLFEATDRLGGQVQTEQCGGWLFEHGPDSLVTAKAAARDLCRELGLEGELLAPRSAATFSLVRDGRLHPLPAGFRMIAPTEPVPLLRSRLLSWPGKLRMLLEPWVPRRAVGSPEGGLTPDESVEDFVVRRFGREAYERIAEPVLGGLFVSDVTRLSARRALGPFVELEESKGSVLRGLRAASAAAAARSGAAAPPAQLTLERGLGSLVTRLVEEIPASWLKLGCGADVVRRTPGQESWHIETASGNWRARQVVLACPAPRCRDLLQAGSPAVARALGEIGFESCVTVNAVYPRSALRHPPRDFGFFVPHSEPHRILAAAFPSEKFPGRAPAEHVVVRTFQGGAFDPDALGLDDRALTQRSHEDIAQLIGATSPPLATRVSRFRQSMPQFGLGHYDRVEDLRRQIEALPGLHIVGSGLGHYGLPDCVASGEAAAAAIEFRRGRAEVVSATPSATASAS